MKHIYLENISDSTLQSLTGFTIEQLESISHITNSLYLKNSNKILVFAWDDEVLHIIEKTQETAENE